MARLIDERELFGGARFCCLSDAARLHWIILRCASNTLGRLELNYERIVAQFYHGFKRPPTEEQFWAWIKEYYDARLLFVYESNGDYWGQWDVSEKFLPKYKTEADRASPAPDAEAFRAWKLAYVEAKRANPFAARLFGNLAKSSADSEKFSLGVGVGVGAGVGVVEGVGELPLSAGADFAVVARPVTFESEFERWWPHYWKKSAKKRAKPEFERAVRNLTSTGGMSLTEATDYLIAKAVEDRRRFERTPDWESRSRLDPERWLKYERWNDEPSPRLPSKDKTIAAMELFVAMRGGIEEEGQQ